MGALFVMIFTIPLSFSKTIPCRVGKQQIINMACGCGVVCLVGASKNRYFKFHYGLILWQKHGFTEVKESFAV